MFRTAFQRGFCTIFYSLGSHPLTIWKTHVTNGHVKRLNDNDVKSLALEIYGLHVETTYIETPIDPKMRLGIKLPFLVLLLKNMKKCFSFQVQIIDDKNILRRFRLSNYQSATRVTMFNTSIPLALSPGWNQIQFNLADFTRRAYGTNYLETVRVRIHANVRIRRVYFTDRLRDIEELPSEYRLMTASDIAMKKRCQFENPPEARPTTPEKTSPHPDKEIIPPKPIKLPSEYHAACPTQVN